MPRDRASIRALLLLVCGALLAPALARAEPTSQPLFTIERSKNAKVVQYDARVHEDGSLDADEPIDVYWLKPSGERKELKWLQRRAAYGFAVHWDEGRTGLSLEMVAPIGRRVRVVKTDAGWQARTRIDGHDCHIERIYVKSTERMFLPPRVDYVDFAGTDASGKRHTERFVPD
jgi:hypothetical protein